jgi:hypothetical protein
MKKFSATLRQIARSLNYILIYCAIHLGLLDMDMDMDILQFLF